MSRDKSKSLDWRSPKVLSRLILGTLLAANLVVAAIVFKPWAGSLSDLERQAESLRSQVQQQQANLERLRGLVKKVETARADGDRFMDDYLLSLRTVSSTLLSELEQTARKAGVKPKESTTSYEPLEGTETLSKAIITANYEGTYADLMQFLNLLDHSPRLLIIESLSAAPAQAGLTLNVQVKLNAFVRDAGAVPANGTSATPEAESPARNLERASR